MIQIVTGHTTCWMLSASSAEMKYSGNIVKFHTSIQKFFQVFKNEF